MMVQNGPKPPGRIAMTRHEWLSHYKSGETSGMRIVLTVFDGVAPRHLMDALDTGSVAVDVAGDMADSFAILSQYSCDALVIAAPTKPSAYLAMLRRSRQTDARLPILVYGVSTAADRVACLEAGADEVVVAGCDGNELVARLHAIVRRSKGHSTPCVVVGNLCLDVSRACVRVSGCKLQLTRKEYKMLEMLVVGGGASISKVKLLDALYFGQEERDEGIIGVFLCMLRKKLREAGAQVEIETFRGIGYSLRARSPEEAEAALSKRQLRTADGRLFIPAAPPADLPSHVPMAAALSRAGAEFRPSFG